MSLDWRFGEVPNDFAMLLIVYWKSRGKQFPPEHRFGLGEFHKNEYTVHLDESGVIVPFTQVQAWAYLNQEGAFVRGKLKEVKPNERLAEALQNIAEQYNGDLAAFFDDIKKELKI